MWPGSARDPCKLRLGRSDAVRPPNRLVGHAAVTADWPRLTAILWRGLLGAVLAAHRRALLLSPGGVPLSDYERQRLANIAANRRVLEALTMV